MRAGAREASGVGRVGSAIRMTLHDKTLPLLLTMLRALLGPVVLLAAFLYPSRLLFGASLVIAFVSDILDGMIARRLKVATAGLRRLDSIADSIFYISAAVAAWALHPAVISEHAVALQVLIFLELARYAFDYAKFRREASYHMWSSKAWGVLLFVGFYSLLVLGQEGLLIALAIYAGIVADVEGLAISVVLPAWQADVPTLIHALRYREGRRAG
jgi:CDP-diacylglycerol--glycerol-3-phosphate 3-phosphatidyltransferase